MTQPNVGSAGGWNRCLSEGLSGGWDAVWLMDDDGYPHPEALSLLESAVAAGVACVSSVVLCESDPDRFVFPFPVLDGKGDPVLFARRRTIHGLTELRRIAPDPTYPFAHLFNGALVPIETVRQIGNVESGFFLMGDEVEYFFRMRRSGAVLSHLGAYHLHPDVSRRPLDTMKFYYYVKNTIILNRMYLDQGAVRDVVTVAAGLVRVARRNSIAEAVSYVIGGRAPILWKAVVRGLRGQIGRDFDAP